MGFSKETRTTKVVLRWVKTMFVFASMFISLLLVSAPLFLVLADALFTSLLLSVSLSPSASLSIRTLLSQLCDYDFRYSLIDIPFISIIRSLVILCVYSLCDGPRLSRGPYLGITTICSVSSLLFVSLKASYVFNDHQSGGVGGIGGAYDRHVAAALFVCSLLLAAGHVVVAYRTSCRERRKLLIYKIDVEAVSACKNVFPRYQNYSK